MNKRNIILKWLNKEYGNLTSVVKDDKTYYVDKNRLPLFFYNQDQKNGWIYINYDRIWLLLRTIFGMHDLEISGLLKVWLEDTYNLRGYTPSFVVYSFSDCWRIPII